MDIRRRPVAALQFLQMVIQMRAGIYTLIDRQTIQGDGIVLNEPSVVAVLRQYMLDKLV